MTATEKIKDYLERIPEARERANKNRAIANIVFKDLLPTLVQHTLTYDRAWRKVTEDNPELRGSDYCEKDELEIKAQRDLGYPV